MAYLLFGLGVLLVLGSVVYTYRVDRRVKNAPSAVASPSSIPPVVSAGQDVSQTVQTPLATSAISYPQVMKRAQVKESISSIGEDLDELIDELRDKEAEVKQILHRVKGWKAELSVDEKMDMMTAAEADPTVISAVDEPESGIEEPAKTVKNESEGVDSNGNELDAKYAQMIALLDQGRSAEEVARMLNMGQREVELVQKMRQKGA